MEGFFVLSCKFDAIALQEILLRYKASFFSFTELLDFVEYVYEKERKDLYRGQYNALLPLMVLKFVKYKTFDDFYESATGKNIDTRPTEVIMKELEDLHGHL